MKILLCFWEPCNKKEDTLNFFYFQLDKQLPQNAAFFFLSFIFIFIFDDAEKKIYTRSTIFFNHTQVGCDVSHFISVSSRLCPTLSFTFDSRDAFDVAES